MSQTPPPPQPPRYLERPYASSQKGGTLIAEDVIDLETHGRRLYDPDGYRPSCCPRCGHPVLHVHDYRPRVLRADPDRVVIKVVRHRCVGADCGARWLTLPLLLWRRWVVVEATTQGRRRLTGRRSRRVQRGDGGRACGWPGGG